MLERVTTPTLFEEYLEEDFGGLRQPLRHNKASTLYGPNLKSTPFFQLNSLQLLLSTLLWKEFNHKQQK